MPGLTESNADSVRMNVFYYCREKMIRDGKEHQLNAVKREVLLRHATGNVP